MIFSVEDWIEETGEISNQRKFRYLELAINGNSRNRVVLGAAKAMLSHFAPTNLYKAAIEDFICPNMAKVFEIPLPKDAKLRSGDIGEIIATEFISERTNFLIPLKKLRRRIKNNMPMLGEDVIGLTELENSSLQFLKVEVKSGQSIRDTVSKAGKQLDQLNGKPSPGTLFNLTVALSEMGESDLRQKLLRELSKKIIKNNQIVHMIFILSGSKKDNIITKIRNELIAYKRKIKQIHVGVRVKNHPDFINKIYKKYKNILRTKNFNLFDSEDKINNMLVNCETFYFNVHVHEK